MKNNFSQLLPPGKGRTGNVLASLAAGGLFLASFLISGNAMAQAPANDDCSGAITLTLGAGCVTGSNVNATSSGDPANCASGQGDWASVSDATVWYKVQIDSAGIYSFSVDNGTNQLGEDTQLMLAFGTCVGTSFAPDSVFCSEDALGNAANGLAAIITKEFPSSLTYPLTVYLIVDIWGTTQGSFCINAYKNERPSNDCIANAIDITADINAVTGANRFDSKAYIYNAPSNPNFGNDPPLTSDDPQRDYVNLSGASSGPTDDISCNNPVPGVQNVSKGIWYRFMHTVGTTPPVWLSVFPNNGENLYVATLFKETGTLSYDCNDPNVLITGLEYVDCSTGDGLNVNGGSLDKSKCSNLSAARLDLSSLSSGTYYLRVAQFTKVLVDTAGTGTPADPDNGIFNLTIEEAPSGTTGADGLTNDKCPTNNTLGCSSGHANRNVTSVHTGLSNAGMTGNIYAANGGTACSTPNANEPAELVAVAGSSGEFQRNCAGTNFTGTIQHDYNNSGIYRFTVTDSVTTVFVTDDNVYSAINSLLNTLQSLSTDPDYQTAVSTIRTTLATLLTTVDATVIATVEALLIELSNNPTYDLGLLEPTKDSVINEILALLDDLVVPVPTPFPCIAQVSLTFDNIESAGVNGNIAFFNVIRSDNCSTTGTSVMAGFSNSFDNCMVLRPAGGKLPAGTYSIIVDGEQGQLLSYDITLDIQYVDSLTGIACGTPCGAASTLRKGVASLSGKLDQKFAINYIKPVPATDRIEFSYNSNTSEVVNLTVMDIVGSRVYNGRLEASQGSNINDLNITSFKPGIYFLVIEKGNERIFSKFVKSE